MHCDDFNAALPDYLAGELDTPALLEAEQHAAACDACRAHAMSLGAAQRAAASLVPTPHRATAAVQAVARSSPTGRSRRPLARALAIAASLALAFVFGALSQRRSAPAEHAPPAQTQAPRVQDTYIRAAQEFPNQSRLTWGLLSVARH